MCSANQVCFTLKATVSREAERNSWSCSEPFANLVRQEFCLYKMGEVGCARPDLERESLCIPLANLY